MSLNVCNAGSYDIVSRYFLRQQALAHRENPDRPAFVHYKNILGDTVTVFVMFPVIAASGFIVVVGLPWWLWAPIFSSRFE